MLKNLKKTFLFTSFLGLFLATAPIAEAENSLVLLEHTNNSGYDRLTIGHHIDKSLIAKLIEGKQFVVRYRYPIKESLEAEEDLKLTKEEFREALKASDFDGTIALLNSDITSSKENAQLNENATSKIGQLHNAAYLLHCTIDRLGADGSAYSVNTSALKALFPRLPAVSFDMVLPNLQFVATFRLVRAQDGKVIWTQKEFSTVRDTKVISKYITVEDTSSVEKLLIESAKKVTDKATRHLLEALEKKEVVL